MTLNDVCPPLPTAREMAKWDRLSAERCGLTPELLMDSAAREAFAALVERFADLAGLRVLVMAGPGNNGGDAIALARRLHDASADVRLVLVRPVEAHKGAAAFHLDLAVRCAVPVAVFDPKAPDTLGAVWPCADVLPDVVVDGLLGSGLAGPPRPPFPALLKVVNRVKSLNRSVFVLALDTPSGLDVDSGKPVGVAPVKADLTVTFQAAKPGLVLERAAAFVGELRVVDIGLPRVARDAAPPRHRLLAPAVMSLLPPVPADLHKGRAGRVLVVGGSRGLTGAPLLSALAALRAGGGLVTLACPGALAAEIKAGFPEVMTLPVGDAALLREGDARVLLDEMDRFDALAVGLGLGRADETGRFLEALLAGLDEDKPVILDADGLTLLAGLPTRAKLLKALGARALLTPHPGEMAALLDSDLEAVEADRPGAVRAVTTVAGANLLLKGANTLVGGPDGVVYVNPFAAPALAMGGSGDALTGLAAAMAARLLREGLEPPEAVLQAACVSAYWHGFTGEMLAKIAPRGHLARELADALPHALAELTRQAPFNPRRTLPAIHSHGNRTDI